MEIERRFLTGTVPRTAEIHPATAGRCSVQIRGEDFTVVGQFLAETSRSSEERDDRRIIFCDSASAAMFINRRAPCLLIWCQPVHGEGIKDDFQRTMRFS